MPRWLYATLAISVFGVAAVTQAVGPVTPGPADADLDWIYFSCPTGAGVGTEATSATGRAATSGTMAATHVTKLTIHLHQLEVGNDKALALVYDYSTMEVPSGNGFSVNTGLGTLSCQVNGMTVDYSGPPTSKTSIY